MLKQEMKEILRTSRERGWVLEPEAKRLLSLAGLSVPEFQWGNSLDEALKFAEKVGYPVVAKVVSPKVLHKTDSGGVVVGIEGEGGLKEAYQRLSALDGFEGVLVEEMVIGLELIVGAKVDYQFGPVILMGLGGTGVEIYKDTTLRMAPLKQKDVGWMIKGLKGRELLEGYRGSEPVSLEELTRMLLAFSSLVMEMEEEFESIDLNPVICSSEGCIVADARIMIKG